MNEFKINKIELENKSKLIFAEYFHGFELEHIKYDSEGFLFEKLYEMYLNEIEEFIKLIENRELKTVYNVVTYNPNAFVYLVLNKKLIAKHGDSAYLEMNDFLKMKEFVEQDVGTVFNGVEKMLGLSNVDVEFYWNNYREIFNTAGLSDSYFYYNDFNKIYEVFIELDKIEKHFFYSICNATEEFIPQWLRQLAELQFSI